MLQKFSPKRRLLERYIVFNNIDNEDNTETFSSAKYGSHIRNLFTDETEEEIGENVLCAGQTEEEIGENILCAGQMCFSCTFTMSTDIKSKNYGIRCTNCLREYHIKCIQIKYIYLPKFICKTCQENLRK